MFSSIGLPGLNGFVGEFLTLLGAFASHRWWAVVAAVGVIIAALYLLWAYQRVFHGTPDEANRSMPDLRAREAIVLAPAPRSDRVPRCLSQARARAHGAFGRRTHRSRQRAMCPTSPRRGPRPTSNSKKRRPNEKRGPPRAGPTTKAAPAEENTSEPRRVPCSSRHGGDPVAVGRLAGAGPVDHHCGGRPRAAHHQLGRRPLAPLVRDRLDRCRGRRRRRVRDPGVGAGQRRRTRADIHAVQHARCRRLLSVLRGDHQCGGGVDRVAGPRLSPSRRARRRRVLCAHAAVRVGRHGDGGRQRSARVVPRARGLVDRGVCVGRHASAPFPVARSRHEVLRARRVLVRRSCSMASPWSTARPARPTSSTSARSWRRTVLVDGQCTTACCSSAWRSCSSGWASRSPPCRSIRGVPTSIKAHRPRRSRSWRLPSRRPASPRCCGSSSSVSSSTAMIGNRRCMRSRWRRCSWARRSRSCRPTSNACWPIRRSATPDSSSSASQAASAKGTASCLFYLAAYTFMVIGSFGVVTLVGRTGDARHSLDDYRGLGARRPVLAFAFTLLLLAQAGVPFTTGFFAKFYVVQAATEAHSYWLAIVAMVSAVIAAFLYLRIVLAMYASDADAADTTPRRDPLAGRPGDPDRSRRHLVFGFLPSILEHWARDAVPAIVAVRRLMGREQGPAALGRAGIHERVVAGRRAGPRSVLVAGRRARLASRTTTTSGAGPVVDDRRLLEKLCARRLPVGPELDHDPAQARELPPGLRRVRSRGGGGVRRQPTSSACWATPASCATAARSKPRSTTRSAALDLIDEFGSLAAYIWTFEPPTAMTRSSPLPLPSQTPASVRAVEGPEAPRLALRRTDDGVRVHAGDGLGQRPRRRLRVARDLHRRTPVPRPCP